MELRLVSYIPILKCSVYFRRHVTPLRGPDPDQGQWLRSQWERWKSLANKRNCRVA